MKEAEGKDGLCKQLMRTAEKKLFFSVLQYCLIRTLEVNCCGIKVSMITGLIMGQLPGLSLSLILDSKVNPSVENFS